MLEPVRRRLDDEAVEVVVQPRRVPGEGRVRRVRIVEVTRAREPWRAVLVLPERRVEGIRAERIAAAVAPRLRLVRIRRRAQVEEHLTVVAAPDPRPVDPGKAVRIR